jgi:hypothetical protein
MYISFKEEHQHVPSFLNSLRQALLAIPCIQRYCYDSNRACVPRELFTEAEETLFGVFVKMYADAHWGREPPPSKWDNGIFMDRFARSNPPVSNPWDCYVFLVSAIDDAAAVINREQNDAVFLSFAAIFEMTTELTFAGQLIRERHLTIEIDAGEVTFQSGLEKWLTFESPRGRVRRAIVALPRVLVARVRRADATQMRIEERVSLTDQKRHEYQFTAAILQHGEEFVCVFRFDRVWMFANGPNPRQMVPGEIDHFCAGGGVEGTNVVMLFYAEKDVVATDWRKPENPR